MTCSSYVTGCVLGQDSIDAYLPVRLDSAFSCVDMYMKYDRLSFGIPTTTKCNYVLCLDNDMDSDSGDKNINLAF